MEITHHIEQLLKNNHAEISEKNDSSKEIKVEKSS